MDVWIALIRVATGIGVGYVVYRAVSDLFRTRPAERPTRDTPASRQHLRRPAMPAVQPARAPVSSLERRGALQNLDASRFAPLSGSASVEFIKGYGSSWKNAYLDPLNRIPDAGLPRIQLIDRAMVGVGLITPEELAEIHEVGVRMGEAQGAAAAAHRAAEQAVARTAQEREALKQRKKAEAAERRRRRAEQVAERRRTDIVFLGRGVSIGLADRRANVELLRGADLPVLAAPADLAGALGLTIPRLRWLAYHSEASGVSHYVRFTVPKRSGGTRSLFAPHRDIAACQRWILDNILAKVAPHDAAHGFVAGRSTVTNASPHVGRSVVVNLDLSDFFPSVTFPRVKGIFQAMGYSPAAATVLALLVTECPRRTVQYGGKTLHVACGVRHLPQGACTSPALSNLVVRRLDARLAGLARKLAWTYTRYADDITFSADGAAADAAGYLLARVRHIVADEGFAVNEKKTRVLRRSAAQTVTGVVVNDRPGVRRHVVRRIRAILHRAARQGLAAQNRRGHPHFEAWLLGMIAYISMVNPAQGARLRQAYEALPPTR